METAALVSESAASPRTPFAAPKTKVTWQTVFATGTEARWNLGKAAPGTWVGFSDVLLPAPVAVQFLGSGSGPYRVWLNGKVIYQRTQAGVSPPDADRFTARLDKGLNRLVVQLTVPKKVAEVQLRFRRVSSRAEHEKLTEAALTRKGNPEARSQGLSRRGQIVLSQVSPPGQSGRADRPRPDGRGRPAVAFT